MRREKEGLREKISYRSVDVLQWCVYALAAGICCGAAASVFGLAVERAGMLRESFDLLIWFMPLAGIAIVALYRVAGIKKAMGTNRVIMAVRRNEGISLRMAPLIFASSVLTHLTGGSSGREGAALQIGGSIANFIGRKFRMSHLDLRTMTMCGMSAGFSGLFGTPITAALFAMEVSGGALHYAALFPCLLSSVTAKVTGSLLGAEDTFFTVEAAVPLIPSKVLAAMILGAMCALVSVIFCETMRLSGWAFETYFRSPYVRIAVAGLAIAAATTLMGTRDYNGAGGEVIVRALSGEARPFAFLLKILFTALTLEAGFKGGEIVPTLFIGATFGCSAAPLLGLDPGFAAALGMAGLFCGVTNCPVASIFLAFELFGGQNLVLFALCCSLSYVLSGHYSLYSAQMLKHDKFHLE